ncbi:MAG: AAA family ATPase [Hyphomicrobiaceae bacterium]|nr:AAA family ATPase [Hyphomicrobiaceae bacterium]
MLTEVAFEGYRSVRELRTGVGQLTVFVGKNGVGKTNLYRALYLLHAAAAGTITREIAREGGVQSVLWAGGREDEGRQRLRLEATLGDLAYRIEVGLPALTEIAMSVEPRIREEELVQASPDGPILHMQRRSRSAVVRLPSGKRETHTNVLLASETAISAFRDASRYPAIEIVRRTLLDWRFYENFRVDGESPIRSSCLAISTPSLAPDGHDLAATIATVLHVAEDQSALERAVVDAFPGARLSVNTERGRCSLAMKFADMPRQFEAQELSDGTLRYLCLIGALTGYRPPSFIALNEPEASLHGEMLEPLARLIAKAAERSQIWVVTHSPELGAALQRLTGVAAHEVVKVLGATEISMAPAQAAAGQTPVRRARKA